MSGDANTDPWDPTRKLDIETRGELVKRTLFIPKIVDVPSHIHAESPNSRRSKGDTKRHQKPSELSDTNEVIETDSNATRFRLFAEHWLKVGFDRFVNENPYHFLIQETLLTRTASSGYFTMAGTGSQSSTPVDLFAAVLYRLKKKNKAKGTFPHMITVGRASNNDIFIKDHLISKFHAYFMKRGEKWYVADSGSTNGTYVNGESLEATVPYPLTVNSLISFSDNLTYRFVDSERVLGYLRFFETQSAFNTDDTNTEVGTDLTPPSA